MQQERLYMTKHKKQPAILYASRVDHCKHMLKFAVYA